MQKIFRKRLCVAANLFGTVWLERVRKRFSEFMVLHTISILLLENHRRKSYVLEEQSSNFPILVIILIVHFSGTALYSRWTA